MNKILRRSIGLFILTTFILMISAAAGEVNRTYNGSIASYQDFRNGTNNTDGYDTDGNFGRQCWDGVQILYLRLGMSLSTGNVWGYDDAGKYGRLGYAKYCWDETARSENTGTQFTQITRIEDVKRGDVIVFSGPYVTGHIGFADEDYNESKDTITVWGQNQEQHYNSYFNCYEWHFTSAEFNKSYFLGAFRYKGWAKYKINFDPNGGTGETASFEKNHDESFILSKSTVSFSKTNYFLDHWSTTPDDTGTKYYFGNDLNGLNSTLYAIWYEAIPPELTGDVYASNISYNSFTITAPVTDNVGVTSVSAQVAPYIVPSNKKTVHGTYDNATKTATVTVSLDKLKFRSDLYNVRLIARDAAGNTLNYDLDPLSTYIIDTTDKGIWKSKEENTPVYASPASSGKFNGISQIKRYVNAGEKFDMLGSMEADGTEWLRIGATSEFVKKSDFKYDTISNLWRNIVSKFVFVLEGQSVYASEGPSGRVKLNGKASTSIGSPSVGTAPNDSDTTGSGAESNSIVINETNFPDEKFRSYVSVNFDTDKNGTLSYAERNAVSEINLTGTYYIYDLTGIQFFPNLETLDCSNQGIRTLDLSANKALTTLICSGNSISELNFSNNPALQRLECDSIGLQVLDLTANEAVEYISCVKQGAFSLMLGSCPVLKELYCYGNGLSSLDLSGCLALVALNCSMNNLTSIDVSMCGSLRELYCGSNNDLTSLILDNPMITYLDCNSCKSLTLLDISGCSRLRELYCRFCALSKIDVTHNPELNEFWCCGNPLKTLDVSQNAKLGHLYCVDTQLEALDVSHNPELWGLSCGMNRLTELDLSHNPLLSDLSCYGNQITYLDLSQNPALYGLRVYDNQLTSLDLTSNPNLAYVWAENNSRNFDYKADIDSLPGFDPNKITNLTGGLLLGHYLYLLEDTIHYNYLCNDNFTITFSITGEPVSSTDSGKCGDNLFWNLFDDEVLVFSGSGDMYNYGYGGAPWYNYSLSITEIVFSEDMTTIGDRAFYACSQVEKIQIPSKVTSIGECAFLYAYKLNSVAIGEGVTDIKDNAFGSCKDLITVIIPRNVQNIGEWAFWLCDNLIAINVEEGSNTYKSVDGVLFNKDGSVLIQYPGSRPGEVFSIPDSVETIAKSAFTTAKHLKTINMTYNIKYIKDYALSQCESLEKIIIPESVMEIGWAAFSNNTALESVTIESNHIDQIINGAFAGCSNLKSIIIPDSILSIKEGAFNLCDALSDVYYTGTETNWNSVVIDNYNSALMSATIHYNSIPVTPNIILPPSLRAVESEAFIGIPYRAVVYVPETVTSIESDSFDADAIIITPAGSYAAQWAQKNNLKYYEQQAE